MLGLLVPLVLAGGWELAVRFGFSSGRLVPPPSRVYTEFAELARSGELLRHVTATLLRVGAGFAVEVWADPKTGETWVYACTQVGKHNSINFKSLRRLPLDGGSRWEPVWAFWPSDPPGVTPRIKS